MARPVSAVAKHIAIGAVDLGFDSKASLIGHGVENNSPPLRCLFGGMLPKRQAAEMDLATHYTLQCNIASIMKISFFLPSGC